MLMLTTMLLLIVALAFGFSQRPWWQIGTLALIACGPLHLVQFWMDDWRARIGLASPEPVPDLQVLFQIVSWLLVCSYVGYALGLFYSRRRRVSD